MPKIVGKASSAGCCALQHVHPPCCLNQARAWSAASRSCQALLYRARVVYSPSRPMSGSASFASAGDSASGAGRSAEHPVAGRSSERPGRRAVCKQLRVASLPQQAWLAARANAAHQLATAALPGSAPAEKPGGAGPASPPPDARPRDGRLARRAGGDTPASPSASKLYTPLACAGRSS